MIKLPHNEYVIVDPCYVLNPAQYDVLISNIGADGLLAEGFEIDGHPVAVFHTRYGDGIYPSFVGGRYTADLLVDAGIIGAIPVSLVDPLKLEEVANSSVRTTGEMLCVNNDGDLLFRNTSTFTAIEIPTGWSEIDWGEEDDEY